MQTRRNWFITAGTAVLAIVFGPLANAAKEVPLGDRLRAGLKARTNDDFAFIDHVVELVDDKVLPVSLVDRTFFWARKRAKSKSGKYEKRPMIYFKPALIRLAKKIGVDV